MDMTGWLPLLRRRLTGPALAVLTVALAAPGCAQAAPAGPVGPENLTYLTEDYASSNFVENGQLKGIAVDLMKAMWKEMGVPEQPIEVINWARGFKRAVETPGTVLFAMTRNAEREHQFLWVGPIYHGIFALYSHAGRRMPLATVAEAGRHRVGVLRQDAAHAFMTAGGVPEDHLEKVAHVRQLVQMLEAGRVDLICLPSDSLHAYLAQERIAPATFTLELEVYKSSLFFAFNKATPPALVQRFQAALDRLDPERRRIVKHYGGTP